MDKKKQILFGLGGTFILVVILGGVKAMQISAAIAQAATQGPPPEAVTTYVTKEETWNRTFAAVGSFQAVQGAVLSAQEAGKVTQVEFASGDEVQKGDLLVELDTAVERAQLKSVLAQLELAEITAKRQRSLREKGANSKSDLDSAEANLRDLQAEKKRLQAVIERKQIIAPFSGKTGIRKVNVGDMLAQEQEVISLHSFDSLYLDFALPQRALGSIERGSKVTAKVDAFPELVFEGEVTAIEAQVDAQTRNISIQSTIKNPEQKLRPGMFAEVTVFLPKQDKVIAIPASSVQYAPYGNTVWIIQKEEKGEGPQEVKSQFVKLGRRLGDRIAVESGIGAGVEIVSSGLFKMRPGVKVVVNNSVSPKNELNPNPKDI